MPYDWQRPLEYIEHGSIVTHPATGELLPAIRGGPFGDAVTAMCVSPYGPRTPLLLPDGSYTAPFHSGTDWWAADWPTNPPALLSMCDGIVEFADFRADVGNWIGIRTLDGAYRVEYYHLAQPSPLHVGDSAYMGQVVGQVGSTGYSTGNHLHLQIIDNTSPVDPLAFLKNAPKLGVPLPPTTPEEDYVIAKKSNVEAIGLLYQLLGVASAVAGQADGQFIGVVESGSQTPAGYRDVIVRIKE